MAIFEISPKKIENVIFDSRDYASSKKLGNSDARFWKKMQKTSIFGHLGQKEPFWTVFGQNGQNGENYQKSAWNIALTNYKVSEKSNERFPRTSTRC